MPHAHGLWRLASPVARWSAATAPPPKKRRAPSCHPFVRPAASRRADPPRSGFTKNAVFDKISTMISETFSVGSSLLSGAVVPPLSKSLLHRRLIATALADGASLLAYKLPCAPSKDILATYNALSALVKPIGDESPVVLDCGESGTTLRLLVPIVACLGRAATFVGHGRLPNRPMQPYADAFASHGVTLEFPDRPETFLPLTLSGCLQPGIYSLPGNISSQFISGLLFALPLLGKASEIRLTSPLESEAYVRMTIATMKEFGIDILPLENGGFAIPENSRYSLPDSTNSVETDASQAAFWHLANFLGSSVAISGETPSSLQGDSIFPELLDRLRAETPGDTLDIDVSQTPDLVPALAAAAAYAPGTTRLVNAARLRIKESDRLSTTCALLRAFGSECQELPDALVIPPGPPTPLNRPVEVDGANDHRIVMTAAMLATRHPCTIKGTEAVDKSYPTFFDDYRRVGGIATRLG